jgi:hypothetical protein
VAESKGSRSRWRFLGRRSGEPEKTFKGDGYSFNYPSDWRERPYALGVEAGAPASLVALAPRGHDDGLLLGIYHLSFAVTERNIDRFAAETAEKVTEAFQGRISEGPTLATVGDRPAFQLELSSEKPGGGPIQSRMIFVFDGATEYFFNFQFTRRRAEEMNQGCERVVNSFRIE